MRLSILYLFTLLAACAGSAVGGDSSDEASGAYSGPVAKTLVYECTGLEFIARRGPGEMAVWMEDRYVVLSRVRSASGEKYQEGDIFIWAKGDEILVEVGTRRYTDCRLNPARAPWEDARRRGVDFRAVGNEPGWHLELRADQHLLFISDYGATRVLLKNPTRTIQGGQVRYHARSPGDELTLVISDIPCTDTMQGGQYPATVEVEHNGKFYQGCGMALEHPWN